MLILPGALPVSPIPEQAFAVRTPPPKTTTVAAPSDASDAKNQPNLGAGTQGGQSQAILKPPPDPDRPTGPPPSFDTTLLEAVHENARNTEKEKPPNEKAAHTQSRYAPPEKPVNKKLDIAV